MKKIMLILMLCTMFTLVSGFQGQKLNTDFNLVVTSNNATSCTWTYIQFPDGTNTYFNQVMTRNGQTFNVTILGMNFTQKGTTCMGVTCTDGATNATGNVCRDVSVLGQNLDGSKSATYIIIVIVSLIIFGGLLIVGIFLPSKNKTDEMTGYVIAVENLKYFKIFCLALAYLVAMLIAYTMWMLSYAYLDMTFITVLFQTLFYIEAIALFPVFMIFIFVLIANKIRDNKIHEYLERGLKTRGDM